MHLLRLPPSPAHQACPTPPTHLDLLRRLHDLAAQQLRLTLGLRQLVAQLRCLVCERVGALLQLAHLHAGNGRVQWQGKRVGSNATGGWQQHGPPSPFTQPSQHPWHAAARPAATDLICSHPPPHTRCRTSELSAACCLFSPWFSAYSASRSASRAATCGQGVGDDQSGSGQGVGDDQSDQSGRRPRQAALKCPLHTLQGCSPQPACAKPGQPPHRQLQCRAARAASPPATAMWGSQGSLPIGAPAAAPPPAPPAAGAAGPAAPRSAPPPPPCPVVQQGSSAHLLLLQCPACATQQHRR